MTSGTTYLITGASRGMGHAYVEKFLRRPNTVVIACVRDPLTEASQSLSALPVATLSILHIVKLDNALPSDPVSAIEHIASALGIRRIDVTIANAGVTGSLARVDSLPLNELKDVMQVNTWSHVLLFQSLVKHGLLRPESKFIVAGSSLGSIGGVEQRPFPDTSYCVSKAALHFISRKIHQEHPDLVVFNMDPGLAGTDMGNATVKGLGLPKAWATVDEAVALCAKQIDGATRETHGGKYVMWDGSDFPW